MLKDFQDEKIINTSISRLKNNLKVKINSMHYERNLKFGITIIILQWSLSLLILVLFSIFFIDFSNKLFGLG